MARKRKPTPPPEPWPDPDDPRILYSQMPYANPAAEGFGTFEDKRFYFYARYHHWDFVMTNHPSANLVEIRDMHGTDDVAKIIAEGKRWWSEPAIEAYAQSFFMSDSMGQDEFSASFLDLDVSLAIVRHCIRQYDTERCAGRTKI